MTLFGRLLLVLVLLGAMGNAPAAWAANFASHLAVYDLKLKQADPASGISDVTGRLVVELNGSVCDGWSVGFRMVSRFLNSDGEDPRLVDLQSTSWESDDGRKMRYTQREYLNSTLNGETRLSASREDKTVAVVMQSDDSKAELPPEVVFPMTHQRRLIEAAKRGDKLDRSVIYDGSEQDKYYTAVTFIGPPLQDDAGKQDPALAGLRSWRITISYFDKDSDTEGEDVPSHQISMRIFENGVSSDLVMDYGDLKLEGTLSEFELRETPSCD